MKGARKPNCVNDRPRLPLAFQSGHPSPDEAKLLAAQAVVEVERRPLVRTDDEHIPGDGPVRLRLTESGVPALLLAPRPSGGLRPEDVARIEAFLTAGL